MIVQEARRQFFLRAGFGDAGNYQDPWVRVRFGPLPVVFPNTRSRRRAVQLHDIHHVLTGYETKLAGETEIGAWELASGLRRHYVGWVLDLLAFAAGLFVNPRKLFRAFVRGRRSANLFRYDELPEELLRQDVDALRKALHIPQEVPPARASDIVAFAVCIVPALALAVAFLSPLFVAVGGIALLVATFGGGQAS